MAHLRAKRRLAAAIFSALAAGAIPYASADICTRSLHAGQSANDSIEIGAELFRESARTTVAETVKAALGTSPVLVSALQAGSETLEKAMLGRLTSEPFKSALSARLKEKVLASHAMALELLIEESISDALVKKAVSAVLKRLQNAAGDRVATVAIQPERFSTMLAGEIANPVVARLFETNSALLKCTALIEDGLAAIQGSHAGTEAIKAAFESGDSAVTKLFESLDVEIGGGLGFATRDILKRHALSGEAHSVDELTRAVLKELKALFPKQ
ncbi:MAG: hypothetical protein HYW49_00655 [Deltaproteobacteria bacterium]|nr:hypothetical protein [Deltaproteobacteria bacterium]